MKLKLILLGFLICSSNLIFAETAITVKDLLKMAAENNLSIAMAKEKQTIAAAQTRQAWSVIMPKFSMDGSVSRIDSYSARLSGESFAGFGQVLAAISPTLSSALDTSSLSGISDYYSAKLNVNQILFNGRVFPAISAADYASKGASQSLTYTIENTYYNVIQLYFSIIKLEEKRDVLVDSIGQLKTILAKVEELKAAGLATDIDVLSTKSSLSGLKVGLINMKNGIDNVFFGLEMTLNKSIPKNIFDRSFVHYILGKATAVYKADWPVEKVLARRGDYQSLAQTLQLMNTNVQIQEAGYWPSLMMIGQYGYTGSNGFNFSDSNRDWMLAVNGTWNLFDFGATAAKVDEARANARSMQHQLTLMKQAIHNELATLDLNVSAAKARIKSLEEAAAVKKETMELIDSKYFLGEVTNLELIDAQNKLFSAKTDLIEARLDYALEILKWLKATGQLTQFLEEGELL